MKLTLTQIEKSTGISSRTLSRYKDMNHSLYDLLKIGAYAKALNMNFEDFNSIKKIESLYKSSNTLSQKELDKWFKIGYALYSKKPKTTEQIETIKLGMLAKANNLTIESLSAYKTILSRINKAQLALI